MSIAFYHTFQNLLPSRVVFNQGYNDFIPDLTITSAPKFGHHHHTPEKPKKFREKGQSVR